MKFFAVRGLLATALLFAAVQDSWAIATLRISANSGVNWLKIRDIDGDGQIAFAGTIGSYWRISVSASTKPMDGTAEFPIMTLAADNLYSTMAGTLLFEFSDTYYGPIPDGNTFKTSLESENAAGGRTTIWTSMGAANTLFDQSTLLGFAVQTESTAYSLVSTDPLTGLGQFSLTTRIAVRHSGAQSSTFSASLIDPPGEAVPDGGATIVLLGFGLIAAGFFGFRSNRLAN